MMDEALEHLVKGIVDNPDDVVVAEKLVSDCLPLLLHPV